MAKRGMGNPGAIQSRIAVLKEGTQTCLAADATLVVAGEALTAAQIQSRLRGADALRDAVDAARIALQTALQTYQAAVPGIRLFIKNYEASLRSRFGVDSSELRAFGINIAKPRRRTVAEVAVSVARAQVTRAANAAAVRQGVTVISSVDAAPSGTGTVAGK